jgi:hypothetical protein
MRYYYHRKATADESCDLKISKLRKDGMLLSGETIGKISWTSSMTGKTTSVIVLVDVTGEPFALLMYSVTDRNGNKTDYDYKVSLETTPCYFGGVRYWFACPSCYQRVGVLYLPPGNTYFRCRHCNNLSYLSRNRCRIGEFGHTSREIDRLRGEIKRWTWGGRPTRKVRRLHTLERKMKVLSGTVWARMERFKPRLR